MAPGTIRGPLRRAPIVRMEEAGVSPTVPPGDAAGAALLRARVSRAQGQPLGVVLQPTPRGVEIARVLRDGPLGTFNAAAPAAERIRVGDRLVSVDGRALEGSTMAEAIRALQRSGDEVELTVQPLPRGRRVLRRLGAPPKLVWRLLRLPAQLWRRRRLLRQASRFVQPKLGNEGSDDAPRAVAPGESLLGADPIPLFPLDDVVMGGMSSSSFDNTARKWRGEVTTRNNGGFCGVRSRNLRPALDLSAGTGIALRVRAYDTQRFELVLRDSEGWNDVSYSASFDVTPETEAIHVPFTKLVGTLGGRCPPDAPPLNLSNVVAVQFLISKFDARPKPDSTERDLNPVFKEGAFEIDILDVALYRDLAARDS